MGKIGKGREMGSDSESLIDFMVDQTRCLNDVEDFDDMGIENIETEEIQDPIPDDMIFTEKELDSPKQEGIRRVSRRGTTYKQRIIQCIKSSETGSRSLHSIYKFMKDEWPEDFSGDKEHQWKNSIRHNLSLHKKTFKRIMKNGSNEWSIFENGKVIAASDQSCILDFESQTKPKVKTQKRPKEKSKAIEKTKKRLCLIKHPLTESQFQDIQSNRLSLILCSKSAANRVRRLYKKKEVYALPKAGKFTPVIYQGQYTTYKSRENLLDTSKRRQMEMLNETGPRIFEDEAMTKNYRFDFTTQNDIMNVEQIPPKML